MSASVNECASIKQEKESQPQAPAKPRKSIHEFKIGSNTRRLFDDGKWYTARVMTEPQQVFDEEKRKFVLSRKIKYYADNQEEWADEDQLNDWAYDPNAEGTKGNEMWLASNSSSSSEAEEEGEDDESVLFGLDNRGSVLSGRKQTKTSNISVAITPSPPRTEIGHRSFFSPAKSDGTKSSDTLSEITGSSEASSCTDPCDESDGRRRSKRARRQTETFIASAKKSPPPPPPSADASGRKNPGVVKRAKAEMRELLMYKMGITSEEIDFALDKMSPPYAQNEAYRIIQNRRRELGSMQEHEEEKTEKFYPHIGMRVRVPEGGANYHGTVTDGPKLLIPDNSKKEVKMWTVTFDDDGQMEDYDFMELLRYRANRPIIKFESCRGRTLNALELFCGEGIVTQAFCKREFNVNSIDIDPKSYAMTVLDIRTVKYEDICFVPDFIWASPPCTTYSNLSGGKHRNAKEGQFEKTQEAHDHNLLFAQMVCIMRWAKLKNPNLIVVIENPQGQLQKMPMMIEFERAFGLYKTTVDYCAFERPDKKPTNLWTNDLDLCTRLGRFRCSEGKCPYFNRVHPIGVRSHKCFNSAAIPTKLAEEVADYVHSKFYIHGVAYSPKVVLSDEEVDELNKSLSCKICER